MSSGITNYYIGSTCDIFVDNHRAIQFFSGNTDAIITGSTSGTTGSTSGITGSTLDVGMEYFYERAAVNYTNLAYTGATDEKFYALLQGTTWYAKSGEKNGRNISSVIPPLSAWTYSCFHHFNAPGTNDPWFISDINANQGLGFMIRVAQSGYSGGSYPGILINSAYFYPYSFVNGNVYNIAITNDTSNKKDIYVDGVKIASGQTISIDYTGSDRFLASRDYISEYGSPPYYLYTADLKVWNRKLTDAEVLQLYNEGES